MKNEILEAIENMVYYDCDTLHPNREKLKELYEVCPEFKNPKLLKDKNYIPSEGYTSFIKEMMMVNKLLTIEKGKLYKENTTREFYKNLFYNVITNPKSKASKELQIIHRYGTKMTPEEYKIYEQVYDELFELV